MSDGGPNVGPGSIAECLRQSLRLERAGTRAGASTLAARFSAPSFLQGPRDVMHGGAVAALLIEVARRHALEAGRPDPLAGAIDADIALHKELRVETGVSVTSEHDAEDGFAARVERDDGQVIATARVRANAGGARDEAGAGDALRFLQAASPAHGSTLSGAGEAAPGLAPPPRAHADDRDASDPSDEVPGTAMCLACGLRNPAGLRFRFRVHPDFVWRAVAPPPHFRNAGGALFHAFATVALDEIGWWLGALRFGGCGLTTRLELAWDPAAAADRDPRAPLLIAGSRRATEPADPRGRYWTSRASLLTPAGRCAASARILFAGSHAYTRAMLEDLAGASDRAAIRRVFPALIV